MTINLYCYYIGYIQLTNLINKLKCTNVKTTCMTLRCAIQLKTGIGVVKHNYAYIVVILTASQATYFNEPNTVYL